ncbi:MAG: galactokinase [Saprospiraceae bacterium]|nr:galactokinase [Saprospiraceae bacterium]
MKEQLKNKIAKTFQQKFGDGACYVFAPGRANIIGEHTDYNDGFVLPFAITQGICFAGKAISGPDHHFYSIDLDQEIIESIEEFKLPRDDWGRYFGQVIKTLEYDGPALQVVFGGDLPIGAGISSSSALTCGFVFLINEIAKLGLSNEEMLHVAVKAERGTGVEGGIMDQYSILFSEKHKAILLDCRINDATFIPLPEKNFHLLLINSNVKHNLVETDYNIRRQECREALKIIQKSNPDINSLRDVKIDDLNSSGLLPNNVLYRRVQHVITENIRVLKMVESLRTGDMVNAGQILLHAHVSLSEQYEVSCEELDFLVNLAIENIEILGARMMGGGFGGCTINILKNDISEGAKENIRNQYYKQFGVFPNFIPIESGDGVIRL